MDTAAAKGYAHPEYAASLAGFGQPLLLPRSGGWLLERPIPGSNLRDAMGCYPLFCCNRWEGLAADLEEVAPNLVSLVLVTDPFGDYDLPLLEQCFDRVNLYKDHYVVDLKQSLREFLRPSHAATVRRANKQVDVRICPHPERMLDVWVELFDHLIERFEISGIRAFSRDAFARQLQTPGLVMFEALAGSTTVGLDLWYVRENVAYGHLVAFNKLGYQLRASYATKWAMLNHFSDSVRWVDLGATAGVRESENDGLARFKSGWSNARRPVYLCCRVFQPDSYRELCAARNVQDADFFPAYRSTEAL